MSGTEEILVRLRKADGTVTLMRVPAEHLQRVMDLANTNYGDTAKVLNGPFIKEVKKTGR